MKAPDLCRRLARVASLSAVSLALVFAADPAAHATFPGANGPITYLATDHVGSGRCCALRTIDADGSDPGRLVSGQWARVSYSADGTEAVLSDLRNVGGSKIVALDLATSGLSVVLPRQPLDILSLTISPDGTAVAFSGLDHGPAPHCHLYTVGIDGSHLTKLPGTDTFCVADWGPNDRLVATREKLLTGKSRIVTMDPDGSDRDVVLTWPPPKYHWRVIYDIVPRWSADGTSIVFGAQDGSVYADVWTVHSDGSDLLNLTQTPKRSEIAPVYSPDGTQIAYTRTAERNGDGGFDLWVMDSDGSKQTRLTHTQRREEESIAWRPV